jgi:ABC-type polysaccharide/polyol phosphate export permease
MHKINNFIFTKSSFINPQRLAAIRMGYYDVISKYRRSMLGPFWITLNMIILVFSISVIYSSIFKIDKITYIPYVFTGMITWSYISTVINESTGLYINGTIKHYNFPILFFPLRNLSKSLIVYFHTFPIYFLIVYFFNPKILNYNFLFFFISIPIFAINTIFISIILGILCLKYRDLTPIISNTLLVMFLATPVFWDPGLLTDRKYILVKYNPLYHFIQIMREPMLGKMPNINSYFAVICVTLFLGILALFIIKLLNKQKAFWV